ncbi:MAG: TonB-dependent receptor domain-containing protein, partial [Armatimonadota bacterium]
GRTDRALTELRQAVALDEDYPQAHYQLAQLYLQSDRARDAVREILTALTKDPSAMLETRRYARTETTGWIGSHEELHLDARHSGMAEEGRLSYFASGVTEDSDGFRAVNHDHSEGLVEVIAGHQPDPDHQLAFYGTWFDTDAALPGPRTEDRPGDPDDRHALSGWDALVAYRSKLSPAASATVKYTVRTSQFRFRNPGSLQVADDNPFRMLENEQTQHMPEVRVEADLQDGTRLSAGYAHQWTDRDRSGEVGAVDPESGEVAFEPFATSTSPETSNFWIEARRHVSKDLSVLIGGRYGKQSGADGVSRPRFVALYRPDRSSWLSLSADPIFRTDIAELAPVEPLADPFGLRYLSFTEGGSGQSYQLRYQGSAATGGTLTGALAYQDVDGLMIDTQDPAFTGLPGRVLVEEGERWVADVGYEQWLNDAVTGRVWVRWQDSEGSFPEVHVTGTEWPYVPQWQLGGRLDYIDQEGWRVGLEGVWVDDRFHDAQNTQAVSGYGLLNLRAQYQRSLHENYFLEILNLTDKGYETFWGFPQSGLAVRAGVEYRH